MYLNSIKPVKQFNNMSCALSSKPPFFCNHTLTLVVFLVFIFLFLPFDLNASLIKKGRIAGQFSVNSNGGADYVIPIQVSPGIQGMQPNLRLAYSNFESNGLLGVGWKLEGLPSITRIPATLAKDEFNDGVDFEDNDRFALNGQALILMNDKGKTYGQNEAEYRTLSDDFTKVVSYGSSGNGPDHFLAWTKNGLIMRFGLNSNSKFYAQGRSDNAVLSWGLTDIYDRWGNGMKVTYESSDGEFRPVRIDYRDIDPNPNTFSPTCSVVFNYENRSDVILNYLGGSEIKVSRKLTKIISYYSGSMVREYGLTYNDTLTGTGKSLITAITEYGANGDKIPATEFQYSDLVTGFSHELPMFYNGSYNSRQIGTSVSADFDGDGRKDILSYRYYGDSEYWYYGVTVAYSNGTSFEQKAEMTTPNQVESFSFGDFNGDGRTDVLFVINRTMYVWLGSPDRNTGFIGTFASKGNLSTYFHQSIVHVGDFNGDGRDDILDPLAKNIYFSNGSGFNDPQTCYGEVFYAYRIGDFNGDGMMDVLGKKNSGTRNYWVFYSNGSTFDASYCLNNDANADNAFEVGDFNGDGLADLIEFTHTSTNEQYVWMSTGTGFKARTRWGQIKFGLTSSSSSLSMTCRIADFNGDGKDDLLRIGYTGTGVFGQLSIAMTKPDASGFDGITIYQNTVNAGTDICAGDFNGDGMVDVLSAMADLDRLIIEANYSQSGVPDMLTSITDGYGAETNINYKPLSIGDMNFFIKSTGSPYPYIDYSGPVFVVNKVYQSNGLGGMNEYCYTYSGAIYDVYLRKFLGFKNIKYFDMQTLMGTSTIYTTSYNMNFPFSGMISTRNYNAYTNATFQSWKTYKSETYSYEAHVYSNGLPYVQSGTIYDDTYSGSIVPMQTYFVYADSVHEHSYGLTGSANAVLSKTTNSTYLSLGNINETTVTNSTCENSTTSKYTKYTYYWANTDDWIIGFVYTQKDISTNGYGSIERNNKYTYYDQFKAVKTIEREPSATGSQNSLHLMTYLEYDDFGNTTLKRMTGWDGINENAVRSTSYLHEYPASGDEDFIPFSHVITTTTSPYQGMNLITKETYNPYYGLIESSTDANGLITDYEYDAFGRLYTVTNPDNTMEYTVWDMALATYDGVDIFTKYYCRKDNVSIITQPPTSQSLDILGRPLTTAQIGFDGNPLYKTIYYDAAGRTVKEQEYHLGGILQTAPRETTYEYDDIGRVYLKTAFDSGTSTFQYDQENGLWTYETNAKSQKKKQKINEQGLIAQIKENGDSILITYIYDANGNMTSITDTDNNVIQMTYDILGRKTSTVDPDMGTWTYYYNAFGEMIRQTDAKGQVIDYEYDAIGRLTKKKLMGQGSGLLATISNFVSSLFSGYASLTAKEVSVWTYDIAPMGSTSGKYALGLLASIQGPDGFTKDITYDDFGREHIVNTTTIDGTFEVITDYDEGGRVSKVTYPEISGTTRFAVNYKYNAAGYLEQVYDAADANKIYWKCNNMTPDFIKTTMGNGVITENSFDTNTGRLLNIHAYKSSLDVEDFTFTYDVLGNTLTRADTTGTKNVNETFEFDNLNRMTSSKTNKVLLKSNYTYYDNGNVKTNPNYTLSTYSYGTKPHAMKSIGTLKFDYDDNGNMTEQYTKNIFGVKTVKRTVEYNEYNMPFKVISNENSSMAVFAYDPEEELVRQEVTYDGTTTVTTYIDDLYEKVVTGTTTDHKQYILANGAAVATHTVKKSGSTTDIKNYYFHKDNLGSITAITNDNGSVDNNMSFTPLGERRKPNTWSGEISIADSMALLTQKGFTGHNQIDAVGLIHMKARLYDPKIGRFISPDTIIENTYNSQALNRYTYCLNNPVSLTDPTGHFSMSKIMSSLSSFFSSISKLLNSIGRMISGSLSSKSMDSKSTNVNSPDENNTPSDNGSYGGRKGPETGGNNLVDSSTTGENDVANKNPKPTPESKNDQDKSYDFSKRYPPNKYVIPKNNTLWDTLTGPFNPNNGIGPHTDKYNYSGPYLGEALKAFGDFVINEYPPVFFKQCKIKYGKEYKNVQEYGSKFFKDHPVLTSLVGVLLGSGYSAITYQNEGTISGGGSLKVGGGWNLGGNLSVNFGEPFTDGISVGLTATHNF